MKSWIGLLFLAAWAGLGAEEIVYTHPIRCVSHRGEGLSAPEGSRPAYRLAVERKAEIIKLDVVFTKDKIPVLSHDRGFKRTMGWDVKAKDVTLQELREKGTFKPVGGYQGEKIVTLAEGLQIVKEVPEFWIDTKVFSPAEFELIRTEIAKAKIAESRVMIATFNRKSLAFVNKNHPQFRRVLHLGLQMQQDGTCSIGKINCRNAQEVKQTILKMKQDLGLYGVNLQHTAFGKGKLPFSVIADLRQNGLWVSLWFIQTEKKAEIYSKSGADAFVTDAILKVRPYCRTRKP